MNQAADHFIVCLSQAFKEASPCCGRAAGFHPFGGRIVVPLWVLYATLPFSVLGLPFCDGHVFGCGTAPLWNISTETGRGSRPCRYCGSRRPPWAARAVLCTIEYGHYPRLILSPFKYRYLAIQDVGGKAKYQTGTDAEAALPSAEIVGQAAGEKFRFNSSDRKPVADTNFNSATG